MRDPTRWMWLAVVLCAGCVERPPAGEGDEVGVDAGAGEDEGAPADAGQIDAGRIDAGEIDGGGLDEGAPPGAGCADLVVEHAALGVDAGRGQVVGLFADAQGPHLAIRVDDGADAAALWVVDLATGAVSTQRRYPLPGRQRISGFATAPDGAFAVTLGGDVSIAVGHLDHPGPLTLGEARPSGSSVDLAWDGEAFVVHDARDRRRRMARFDRDGVLLMARDLGPTGARFGRVVTDPLTGWSVDFDAAEGEGGAGFWVTPHDRAGEPLPGSAPDGTWVPLPADPALADVDPRVSVSAVFDDGRLYLAAESWSTPIVAARLDADWRADRVWLAEGPGDDGPLQPRHPMLAPGADGPLLLGLGSDTLWALPGFERGAGFAVLREVPEVCVLDGDVESCERERFFDDRRVAAAGGRVWFGFSPRASDLPDAPAPPSTTLYRVVEVAPGCDYRAAPEG